MNTHDLDSESRLQAEAERAEREGIAPGRDPRVDRYRLIVRALREPLEPQLPADFAARVAAEVQRRDSDVFENVLVSLLLIALGVASVLCIGPAFAKAVQETANATLVLLPWHLLTMAAVCIGIVWAIERGWVQLHPAAVRP